MNDNEKVSALRVVIYGEIAVKTITVKSGSHAGEHRTVLECRAFHPNADRAENGSFIQKESDWYRLQLWDDRAEEVKKLLKDGMILRVSGSVTQHAYKDKNGGEKIARDLNLSNLAVDLKQPGLKGIDFVKPAKKGN